MLAVTAFISLIFFGVSFLVTKNNAKYILSGYNTMSAEARAQFDLEGYLVLFKKFHRILGISTFVGTAAIHYFDRNIASFFMICYPLVAYSYFFWKSKDFNSKKTNVRWSKVTSILMLGLAIGIGWFSWRDMQDSKFIFNENQIEITGTYGVTINRSDIDSIALVNQLPPISIKTNGFAAGDYNKGHFRTKDRRSVLLFLDTKIHSAIYIKTKDQEIYYNTSQENLDSLQVKISRWMQE